MSYNELGAAIKKVVLWLNQSGIKYALVGGLAVSFRTIERATKDVDFALATQNDNDAETLIRAFQVIGFQPTTLLEHKTHKVISAGRLLSEEFPGIYLDLLFAASGIESEVVNSADLVEILPNLEVKVASLSSLIAMKVLSSTNKHRRQDLLDLDNLIKDASEDEITEAGKLIQLIEDRGYNHNQDLSKLYLKMLSESRN